MYYSDLNHFTSYPIRNFEERVKVRAYYIWLNGSKQGEIADYYEALKIENDRSFVPKPSFACTTRTYYHELS